MSHPTVYVNMRYVSGSPEKRSYEFADNSIRDPTVWLAGAVRSCTITPGPRSPRLRMYRHAAPTEEGGHATLRMTYNWRRLNRCVFGGNPSIRIPSALRVLEVVRIGLIWQF